MAEANVPDPAVPTAFVLSGGGSLGAVQVGMLQALYERGIEPQLITGASVGAFNGAFIASRPPTTETADQMATVWRRLRTSDVFPLSPITGLLGALGWRNHIVNSRRVRRLLQKWVELDDLERAAIPLHVIATDLLSGAELRLSTGPARSAVLASGALPGVFPPVAREGRQLIDGGVTNNTPLSHAIELGAQRIYVLPTGYACSLTEPPRGAIGVAVQALSVLVQHRLVLDIRRVPDDVELIVLPPLCPLDVVPVDFSRTDELIDRSTEQSRRFLDERMQDRHAVADLMRSEVHPHGTRPA